jgi:hypothetical protein
MRVNFPDTEEAADLKALWDWARGTGTGSGCRLLDGELTIVALLLALGDVLPGD